jgi:hypothetical protein
LLEQNRDLAYELVVEQVEDLFGLVEFLLCLKMTCDDGHRPSDVRVPYFSAARVAGGRVRPQTLGNLVVSSPGFSAILRALLRAAS